MNTKYTTIQINRELKKYLDEEGKRGESFNDILKRLLKFNIVRKVNNVREVSD